MIGIGLRKEFAAEFAEGNYLEVDFVEFAPENWMNIGGYWKKVIDKIASKYPIYCHGLSLSIGSPDELDWDFLQNVKSFLDNYEVKIYSEHLSYSKATNAHLYDLLPIPFRNDAVNHISARISQVQDFLDRELVLEIVSYYTPIEAEMSESEFINKIVSKSGCKLLLDVNNIFVNSFNHNYNPNQFIKELPLDKVAYIHIAGHEQVSDDLIIDTHGQPIVEPVYQLLSDTLPQISPVPILLERDFNIPDANELQDEIDKLRKITATSPSLFQHATF
ncbi:MAG: hypothetical protein RLZZ175_1626 [Bacteroidota bacterium]|jgi:uncharacterized protein (UPF0276 family)